MRFSCCNMSGFVRFSTELSKAVPQLQFIFVRASVVSYVAFAFVEYLEFIYQRELASFSYLDCYFYIDNGKLTTRFLRQTG